MEVFKANSLLWQENGSEEKVKVLKLGQYVESHGG